MLLPPRIQRDERRLARPAPQSATTPPAGAPPPAASGKIGVLLVNLGTPDATDAAAVRRYLKEFLSDPRVIEDQGPLWKLVLNGIILPVRPRRKARDYDKIWNRERERIAAQDHHARAGGEARRARSSRSAAISWSTGRCATATRRSRRGSRRWSRKAASASWWCRSIRNIARRPPRPSATRSSACSRSMRDQPAVRIAPPYYDDPVYIEALASSIEDELSRLGFQPEVILASFHGIPKDYRRQGRSLLRASASRRCGCCASGSSSTTRS